MASSVHLLRAACLTASIALPSAVLAFSFDVGPIHVDTDHGPAISVDGVPSPGEVLDAARKFAEKTLKEGGNAIGDIGEVAEKYVRKAFKEVGNAANDLKVLIETGKCGGDICIALEATKDFVKGSVTDSLHAVEDAGKRMAEGKPIDALWHLSIAPVKITEENAAKAAMESSVLRAVGQVAAGAYGGPAGAAAYAAWLTYHATGGNLELALKAGAIAGATAYAMDAISNDVEFIDVIKDVKADEIVQEAVMGGAVSGLAVALSGGSEQDIQQAFTTGAVTSLIREGYKELTKSNLTDNMKASKGVAYCLGADPNAVSNTGERLGCLPDANSYVPKEQGGVVRFTPDGKIDPKSIAYSDGPNPKPLVDITTLDYARSHVGTWATTANESGVMSETTDFMTGVSRVPGMNGMAVAHDIFDATANVFDENHLGVPVVDMAYRIGTITPFVVLTYEGAGFGVQEMIRDVTIKANPEKNEGAIPTAMDQDGQPAEPQPSAAPPNTAKLPQTAIPASVLENAIPVEVRHLYCKSDKGPTKDFLMELNLADDQRSNYERICRIDQSLGNERWAHLWHAHYQQPFCVSKFNQLAVRYLNRGYTCYTSIGVRFDPLNGAALKTAPTLTP